MKKIIVFLIIILVFPLLVNAQVSSEILTKAQEFNNANDNGKNLIYSLDSVELKKGTIRFRGWAIPNREHAIGGKNYNITIRAIETSEFKKGNYSGGKYVTEDKYEGGNALYSSLCYKDENGECYQVFYGFYNLNTKEIAKEYFLTNGISEKGKEYASCTKNQTTDCIVYNNYFDISLDLTEYENNTEFIFIIEINYKHINDITLGNSGSCYFNGVYNGCTGNSKNKTLKRIITFDNTTLKKTGEELGTQITVSTDTKFYNNTDFAGLYDNFGTEDAPKFKFRNSSNEYIAVGEHFTFTKSYVAYTASGGINYPKAQKRKIRWYEIGISNSTVLNYYNNRDYYHPANEDVAYAPATWGVVEGAAVVTLTNPPKRPGPECSPINETGGCEPSLNRTCPVSINVSKNIDGLSESGCIAGKLTIYKFYKVEEEYKVKFNIKDTIGHPGMLLVSGDKKFGYSLIRNVNVSPYDNNFYYHVVRYYKNENNSCTSEDGDVTLKYLNDKGVVSNNIYKNMITELNNSKPDSLKEVNNGEVANTNINIAYEYPDSNDITKKLIGNGNKIISPKDGITVSKENNDYNSNIEFVIKNVYVNKYNANVLYEIPSANSDYINGENNYFIPFNSNGTLQFITNFDNVQLIGNKVSLKSTCEIKVEDGKLETMNYRTIDINEPFPNVIPTIDGRASNWAKYLESNRSLIDRYKDTSKEVYSVELDQNTIAKIRKYNSEISDEKLKNLYINSYYDNKFFGGKLSIDIKKSNITYEHAEGGG